MFIIVVDDHEVTEELDRLDRIPTVEDQAKLDAVLVAGFKAMQADTHVRTGSLVSSEKMESKDGHKKWEGQLSAGGPSTGVNNPVDYAIYEKARGGPHDFMAFFPGFEKQLEETIMEIL